MPHGQNPPPPNLFTWTANTSLKMIHMKAIINVEKAESSALNSFATAIDATPS